MHFQKCHDKSSKFSPEHVRKSKNWDFDRVLLSKIGNEWALKFKGEFCVMIVKNDTKFEKKLTCQFKIDMRLWTEHLKNSKICFLMGFFWTKYIMFDLKKYGRVMFADTEYWCKIWRKTDLCFQNWHKEFRKFSPEKVRKPKNWDFDGNLLSKVENIWA